jgi:hypothetical protein
MREAVDNTCVKMGRNPATLLRTAHLLIDLPGSESSGVPAWVRAHRSSRPLLRGTTEQLAESLQAFARMGISHVQVWLEPNTMAGIDAFQPVLELLGRGYIVSLLVVMRARYVRRILTAFRVLRSLGSKSNVCGI